MKKAAAKRKSAKKPRTPAQRAATARMLAANKARRTPAQKAARKRKNTVPGFYPNPSRGGIIPTGRGKAPKVSGGIRKSHMCYVEKPDSKGGQTVIAAFYKHADAVAYARAYADAHNCRMQVRG